MKITFLILVFSPAMVFGQFYGALGISKYDSDLSSIGMTVSLGHNAFHFDISNNFARGKGEHLDFQSNSSYQIDKTSIFTINFGCNIEIFSDFSLTPIIGWVHESDIFQDSIAFDSYFYDNQRSKLNLGIIGRYYLYENYGLSVQVGTYEKFRASFAFRAW